MPNVPYLALRNQFGRDKFDALFGTAGKSRPDWQRMRIDRFGIQDNPLAYFVNFSQNAHREDVGQIGNRPVDVGEAAYIVGVPNYGIKHPAGSGPGYNVVCVGRADNGEELYVGFGLGPTPLTEKQICAWLIDRYNQPRSEKDLAVVNAARRPEEFDLAAQGISEVATRATGFRCPW